MASLQVGGSLFLGSDSIIICTFPNLFLGGTDNILRFWDLEKAPSSFHIPHDKFGKELVHRVKYEKFVEL
jgi:hypothetical protein